MQSDPLTGLALISVAGIATACFYAPFKSVKGWTWETYWLVFGVTAWILGPWLATSLTVPNLPTVLTQAPPRAIALSILFGALWGVGSLTGGMALRYMGLSLGWAIPLGLCAVLGTLVPPAVHGRFHELLDSHSGNITLASVMIGLAGIAICAIAGVSKDRELSREQKQETVSEFNLVRGLWLSVLSGVMSACMAFGLEAGKPIAATAVAQGTADHWQNTPVFALTLLGGFCTNATWCVLLGLRNRSTREFVQAPRLSWNYALCILAGILWYMQALFYGMGETKMGHYKYAGWSVLMVCIIIFSNVWGLIFREWAGTSRVTKGWLLAGLAVLSISALMTGYGSFLAMSEDSASLALSTN